MSTPMHAAPEPGPGADGGTARRNPSGVSGRTKFLMVLVLVVVLVTVAGQLIRYKVMVERPGPAQNTLGRIDDREVISVSGAKSYPTSGALDFTTVSLLGGPGQTVGLWQYLSAKMDKNAEIHDLPEEDTRTKEEVRQESAVQMNSSQEAAEVVAIRATGAKVGETLTVGRVVQDAPAQGRLKDGDRVLQIDGKPAGTLSELHGVMDQVKAGSTVKVTVERGGVRQDVQVPTAKADSGRAVMGIVLTPKFSFPYTVKVNAGDVGGPSAGLMFTLAIYDKLTPGALTGGKNIAGTGEMGLDGQVGPIGGIRLKMIGAKDAGAKFFLAPAANCNEVKGKVPDGLTAVKVNTFDEARTQVSRIAAGATSGLPAC